MISDSRLDHYAMVDFPPPKDSLPETSAGYVYVFFWIRGALETPFYVGQTERLAGRMNDYRLAQFAACADFRVGEAARYLRESKKCRIVVRYKVSNDPPKDEYDLIRELQISGVRLVNCFPAYDYRAADRAEEKAAIQRFCGMIVKKSYEPIGEIEDRASSFERSK